MSEIWSFIRTSSNRIFGKQTIHGTATSECKAETGVVERDVGDVNENSATSMSKLPEYVSKRCIHVSESKWEELQSEVISGKEARLSGIVAINPTFARPGFVPQSLFRCGNDDELEYGHLSLDVLATIKNDQYEQWMRAKLRSESAFVLMHVCQAAQILERLAVRSPRLVRISFHYYYLEEDFVAYLVKAFPQISLLNLEASIGLSTCAYEALGLLSNLAHLNLSAVDLSEAGLARILTTCKRLESLDVSDNCLITGQCFKNPAIKNQIKRLNIRDCWRIDSRHLIDMVSQKGGLPKLVELIFNSGLSDESIVAITTNCTNLMHLDISFEEFTYNDDTGYNQLSETGFAAIAHLNALKMLRLRHVGKLTDKALAAITTSCSHLTELTLNLRHRHKLTDQHAFAQLSRHCPRLQYFEAVHNHFVGKHSMVYLAELGTSLKYLSLRGDELISDSQAAELVYKCPNLRTLLLDGCPLVNEKTLEACMHHAKQMPLDSSGIQEDFKASLVHTALARSLITDLANILPTNLKVSASDQQSNKERFAYFDGQQVHTMNLRASFFPFYWHDYN